MLVELLEKAASLGIFLFSQPSVFLFDWQVSAKELQTHGFPVWPRMLRIFDNNAQFRDPADLMIAMKFGIIARQAMNRNGPCQFRGRAPYLHGRHRYHPELPRKRCRIQPLIVSSLIKTAGQIQEFSILPPCMVIRKIILVTGG